MLRYKRKYIDEKEGYIYTQCSFSIPGNITITETFNAIGWINNEELFFIRKEYLWILLKEMQTLCNVADKIY